MFSMLKRLAGRWTRWYRGLPMGTALTLSFTAAALAGILLMGGGLAYLSASGRMEGAPDCLWAFGLLLALSVLLTAFLNFRLSARVAGSVRSMSSTMHHLMDDIIEQEEQKRRGELEVLHSQINPHFLYNTLDSVVWMTECGRTQEAVQMVTSLARLFRIALSGGEQVIPLTSELEHARHYLNIQQIRYKNKFDVRITAHPGTEELYTLKLTIQPLLENAIYHGMAGAEEDGLITVDAYREGGGLVIDVADNGVGMPQSQADALLDGPAGRSKSGGSGIGIYNVHRRIQLTFGEDCGLAIHSEPDEGTLVRVRLPALDAAASARCNQTGAYGKARHDRTAIE